MKKNQTIKAWRDADYFNSLSAEERAQLEANPAEMPAVDDSLLNSVSGGIPTSAHCSPCPPRYCY
jgi:mersacidin/lichenicidin family type 2 lantibiotic